MKILFSKIAEKPGDSEISQPPKWATNLLRWYCSPSLLEDLEGDLNEYFERNVKNKGIKQARFIYVIDVLKFFRPYLVRKPTFVNLFIYWIMIGSYLKTSRRSLVRNKLFSVINIIGLAVSMSVGLLVIAFVSDLRSYDNFQEKKDRIYRVISREEIQDRPVMNLATSSVMAARQIKETVTGAEEVSQLRRGFGGDAHVNDKVIPLSGLWTDPSFFKVFTFPLIQGNPFTALKEPYSIVLTEKAAKKLYGEGDALGKSIQFDSLNYQITGIIKDIPKLSHLNFEALASLAIVELQKSDGDGELLSWENIYSNYTYLVLPETTDFISLQSNLDNLGKTENAHLKSKKITLSLQPLNEVVLGQNLVNPIGPNIPIQAVWLLTGLAFVIILSACFNYTNLSLASSMRRSREVGIRKIIGALKNYVLWQFITESVIISLLALIFSFILFFPLKTEFMSLHPFLGDLVSLELSFQNVLYFIALAITVGLLAGLMPALFFSRIKAVEVLKNASVLKVFRHVNMRKTLIVIQYTLSLIFITTTLIAYKQYQGFVNFNLGYETNNILNVNLQGNNGDLLKKEFAQLPQVKGISTSRIVTSVGNIYGATLKYKQDSAGVNQNFVDAHYLPLHHYQFIAGKNFTNHSSQGEESEVIVNEKLLKEFNIGQRDPQKALGEMVTMEGKKLVIVGVLKDFHYGTLDTKIDPMVLRYTNAGQGGYLNLKLLPGDLSATLAAINNSWKKIDKVHPLEAKLYDDQIEQAYTSFSLMVKVIGFVTILTICIASLGLFGMVVFTTETKLKEISIRKVLGASEGGLIYLLSKGFLMLLTTAALIALPVTYFFFDKVILARFAYHQPIGLTEILVGVLIVMLLAFALIGSQTIKAARNNPGEVLKNE